MKPGWQPTKWLDKKSQQGFRGYPVGTTAFNVPSGLVASVLFDCLRGTQLSDHFALFLPPPVWKNTP